MGVSECPTFIPNSTPNCEEITGYTQEELRGELIWWVHDDDTQRAKELFEHTFREGVGVKNFEYKIVKKNGEVRDASSSWEPIKDEKGEFKGIVFQTIDITERKRVEEERERLLEKLKELDKMKTDFLTVAYHEMRSPLAPIVGYVSLLEQGELNETQKKYVNIIEESASQLDELIESLLEVTRIEAERVELTVQTVSIQEIVNNVLERVKPQADAKRQTISAVVPEGIEVEGDEQKITAIFDNLISNAIKYTGEKGRIDVVVEDRKKEKDIRVCVADTGIGIPKEHLLRVFERFYMADTSLTRKGGLGLGLTIVKGYVKLHGGKVWVTSELGKGSKFCFTLK